jgi:DNA-directed RNA polymerase sigma subunit (sigma70/sigma32)
MRKCAQKCYALKRPCQQRECRLHLEYEEDFNCTLITIKKHGPMTLEQIGKRHHISTVRVKQIVDATLLKLKKTFSKENTIYK